MTEAPRVLNARHDPRDRVPLPAELVGPGKAWGPLSRTVRAGSIAVKLRGLDARMAGLVDREYEGFVESAGSAEAVGEERATNEKVATGTEERRVVAAVEVARSPVDRWLHLSKGEGFVEEARVGARWDGGMALWSYGFAGAFEEDASAGRLLLCTGSDLEVAQAIENYLRFFIAARALATGGFLLHSAGVARDGRAHLFYGPSGAGKSTTASHAPADAELLGDDLVLAEPVGEGTWRACGVPFRGSFARGRNASTCARIATACRLTQGPENALEPLPRILAVSTLLAQVPFLLDEPSIRARAAGIIERFVQDVPVRRLTLRRDGTYWALIEPGD